MLHERKALTAAVSFFFYIVFYDIVTAFVPWVFFLLSGLGGGTGRQKDAAVSLIPENLFCRKTCPWVRGDGRSGCMHDPTCPACSRPQAGRAIGDDRHLLLSSPFP